MITLNSLNHDEALRYLGYKTKQADTQTQQLLQECEQDLLAVISPKYLFKQFALEYAGAGVTLQGTGLRLTGKNIAEHLQGCSSAVLLCATISSGADQLIRKAQITDMTRALILDSLASVAVEQVCDKAEALLQAQLSPCYLTWRFSPGYGDFPIDVQQQLLNILDAPKKIGLHADEHHILIPTKSVTAVIGVSQTPLRQKQKGCAGCNLKESCQFRKEGNRCV